MALNPSVKGSLYSNLAGRIVGNLESGDLSGNSAYNDMGTNNGAAFPTGSGLTHVNGQSLTAANAKLQTTYSGKGWGFGSSDAWKWGDSSYPLPVLRWQTSYPTLPTHLLQ